MTKEMNERHIYRKGNRYVVMINRNGLPKQYWGSFRKLASARVRRDEVLALPEAGGRVSIPVTDNSHIVSSIRAPRSTSDGSTPRVDRNIYYMNKRYRVEINRNGLPKQYWGSCLDLASARVRRDEVLARAEAGGHHAAPAPAPAPAPTPTQKAKNTRVERHIHRTGDRYRVEISRKGLERAYWGSFLDLASARRRRDEVLARAYAEGLIIDRRKAKTTRVDRNIYYWNNQYRVLINRYGLPKQYWGIFPNLASARVRRDEVLARLEAGGRHAAPDYNDSLTNNNDILTNNNS
jgi:hypothetical protein